jgi:hypothetical protein
VHEDRGSPRDAGLQGPAQVAVDDQRIGARGKALQFSEHCVRALRNIEQVAKALPWIVGRHDPELRERRASGSTTCAKRDGDRDRHGHVAAAVPGHQSDLAHRCLFLGMPSAPAPHPTCSTREAARTSIGGPPARVFKLAFTAIPLSTGHRGGIAHDLPARCELGRQHASERPITPHSNTGLSTFAQRQVSGEAGEGPGSRGMKMLVGGSVRARAYGPAIRDRGLSWENADG